METNPTWIVVEDPTNDYWEGSIVEAKRANQLRARGVALLPVIPNLFRLAGIGGYHKRSWGAGWSLNSQVPRVVSPMTMFCQRVVDNEFSAGAASIHWCARLVPETGYREKIEAGEPLIGFLSLCADVGQSFPQKTSLTTADRIEARDLVKTKLDARGGFLIGGVGKTMFPADGPYGFGLFGMMPGLRVAWSAVSQAQI